MLNPQVHQSQSALFLHKPIFIHGSRASLPAVWSRPSVLIPMANKHKKLIPITNCIKPTTTTTTSTDGTTTTDGATSTTTTTTTTTSSSDGTSTTKSISTSIFTEEFISVKATVTVTLTVGGFLSHLGLTRRLDDITDLLGHSLLMELVGADLDPESGLEKEKVTEFAHKSCREEGEIKYEADFKVPVDYGEVGAVLLENEHHKEMFIKDIVLDGLPNGSLHLSCNSWLHSKYDNPEKRVFFTNKSYLPSQTPSALVRLREEELVTLRGNGKRRAQVL